MDLNPPEPEPCTEMLSREGEFNSYIDATCPDCGYAPVIVGAACHTYQQNDRWCSCMGCYSAGYLYCENEECDWSYTWGLNPSNPRSESNERHRPAWLVGKWPY